jgi:cell division protein ZapE
VANTLMTVTFLRAVMAAGSGLKVAATSNTLPDRLGEGRFQAEDFQREIAAIASHFDVLRVDGPDYRASQRTSTESLDDATCDGLLAANPGRATDDRFDELLDHLRKVHPVHVSAMLDDLDAVVLRDMHPIRNQGDALLFVHLVDELYDAELRFAATGCRVDELFPESYRHGGYRKKYGRAESRLAAMLGAISST